MPLNLGELIMALPASGAISMSQVNTELGRGATAGINYIDINAIFSMLKGAANGSDRTLILGWYS